MMANSFVENVNKLANATALATGDIVEDTQRARDEAVVASNTALTQATIATNSAILSGDWANKGHNNPVTGVAGVNAEYSAYHWKTEAEVLIGDPVIDDSVVSTSKTLSSQKITDELALKSDSDHNHVLEYEPRFLKGTAFNKNFGTAVTDVATGYHVHDGTNGSLSYELAIGAKLTGFNKDIGTTAGTLAEGNHTHPYEPAFTKKTAFNKNFVVDPNAPAADEVPRGNHIHKAGGISYDNTGNSVITSTTVQGGLQALDSVLGTIEIIEKTYGTIALDGASRTVTITTQGTPTKMDALTKSAGSFRNMLSESACNLAFNYVTAPDNLIEGRFSADVSVEFPSINSSITLTAYVSGVAVSADWSTDINNVTLDGTSTGTLSLNGYLTGMTNDDYIELYITNNSGTEDIVVRSLVMNFDGAPQGALVASGIIILHDDITGRDAVDQHTIGSITNLQTELDGKAALAGDPLVVFEAADGVATNDVVNKGQLDTKITQVVPAAAGNIATLDASGNVADGGVLLSTKAELNGSLSEVFKVANAVANEDAVNKGQMDTLSGTFVPNATFTTHEATANPHGTTHTDVGAAAAVHSHAISDVTSLQDTLDGKYAKVVAPVTDNLVSFAAGGLVADSGVAIQDIDVTPPQILAKKNIANIVYTNGNIDTVTYEGVDNKEIMGYNVSGDIETIDHYLNDTVITGTTTLAYDGSGNIISSTYVGA